MKKNLRIACIIGAIFIVPAAHADTAPPSAVPPPESFKPLDAYRKRPVQRVVPLGVVKPRPVARAREDNLPPQPLPANKPVATQSMTSAQAQQILSIFPEHD